MKRAVLEPAYVLHRRAYRESSLLLEVLTHKYGRISLIAKGVRKANLFLSGLLQPFVPLLISWAGRGEMKTLAAVEAHGQAYLLHKECLYAGFYLNELLMSLLQKWDPHPELFTIYAETLLKLMATNLDERTLRLFEKQLLRELGYGLLTKQNEHAIAPHAFYTLIPEQGFQQCEPDAENSYIFSGKSILAMIQEEWPDSDSLKDAKRLNRLLLAPLLGSRTIYSRDLFKVGCY